MSTHYKKFLRLLENWPIDATKPGRFVQSEYFFFINKSCNDFHISRDLGEHLRKQLKQSLRAGSLSLESKGEASVERQFQALERICNNYHFNKYPRTLQSAASGITAEQCSMLISEEVLRYYEKKREGLFARFVKRNN